jgi:2-succinyl-6-hydroxy-2,4-cyclohexadiene-1-carboxylate synthase
MLFHERFGNISAKHPFPLIFLHGFLGSHLDWLPIIHLLHQKYACVTIDLPAHGKSPYSSSFHSTLEETLQKWPESILVGYSLGGRLALQYGQKHPQIVKGMIVLSSHVGLSSEKCQSQRWEQDLLWKHKLQTLSSKEFLSLWYEQKIFSSLKNRPKLLEHLLNIRTYHNQEELANVLDQVSLAKQPLCQHFMHPLDWICGEEDASYVELYAKFPSSNKKLIPNAGHTAHLENPKKCAEAIDFFATRYSVQTV